jgi:hypothetical protein
MPFNQDDQRERAMISALNLDQRPDRVRDDEDGHLDFLFEGKTVRLLFECKSAPENSDFGTGRDTGLRQLQRWAEMHFAFGWFEPRDNQPRRLWYGSPAMMREWNRREQAYLAPDMALLRHVPDAIDDAVVASVLGDKDVYTFEDLSLLMKDQWKASAARRQPNLYDDLADVNRSRRKTENLYSRAMATRAVRDRIRYLLGRGGTVNNRKISHRYVQSHCVELTRPGYAAHLHRAVEQALAAESHSHRS